MPKKETCHPSDNLAPILAAAEYANCSGKEFLTALGLAYQVHCRLSEEAPVREKGFDHTTQGAYSTACGVAKALRLKEKETANAIAISGVNNNALRVTRTGALSHWKGLAFPNTALTATHATFLAMRGITGPLEIFEGNKGFMHSISGPFKIDWEKENLEMVKKTIIKKYNAEIHSQSTIEGVLEMKALHHIHPEDIQEIEIDTFGVAFHIIGGGEEGEKKKIKTKEEADHSLPYLIAVALLDGGVMPEQYLPERIVKKDVQDLLQKVVVREKKEFSEKFPLELACSITIKMKDGKTFTHTKKDYEGFLTKPMKWSHALLKFNHLTEPFKKENNLDSLTDKIYHLEKNSIADLITSLNEGIHG